jgi:hypothetical protein
MCKHAILPNSIDVHLKDKNKYNILQDKWTRIIQHIQAIEDLITS